MVINHPSRVIEQSTKKPFFPFTYLSELLFFFDAFPQFLWQCVNSYDTNLVLFITRGLSSSCPFSLIFQSLAQNRSLLVFSLLINSQKHRCFCFLNRAISILPLPIIVNPAPLFAFCFLLFAFCFLLFAFCFLLFAFCFLLFAFCFLLFAFCFLLFAFCFLLFAFCFLLFAFCFFNFHFFKSKPPRGLFC